MTKIEIDQPSLERHLKALKKMSKDDAIAIDQGFDKCGDIILRKSDFYCPKDTGALVASHFKEVVGKGLAAELTVGYSAPYAVPVHEIVQNAHAPPTCSKFLERAIRETRGTCTSVMKRQIQVV